MVPLAAPLGALAPALCPTPAPAESTLNSMLCGGARWTWGHGTVLFSLACFPALPKLLELVGGAEGAGGSCCWHASCQRNIHCGGGCICPLRYRSAAGRGQTVERVGHSRVVLLLPLNDTSFCTSRSHCHPLLPPAGVSASFRESNDPSPSSPICPCQHRALCGIPHCAPRHGPPTPHMLSRCPGV